ncbi:MAG: hypothetical protein OQJ97_02700 [Rhodospirillales bacterium]|nr:hypothetical protein [Rhodospirillales bacterium]
MTLFNMIKLCSTGLLFIAFSGCANLNTINRTTNLPSAGNGTAIHLDAQQRLVMGNAMKFCAEPSPDALSSYAASLGFGASIPGEGAVSVANALQSNSASIGLRTQSITLMRDALYRMCEAAYANKMGKIQVASFLRRSQDLTVVILAIEQLTGVVKADPVILTSNASANTSASLLSNEKALEEASKLVAKRKTTVTEATKALEGAEKELVTAQANITTIKTDISILEGQTPPGDTTAKKAELKKANEVQADKQTAVDQAENNLKTARASLKTAEETLDAISKYRDVDLTNSYATATGQGKFIINTPKQDLDAAQTKDIAAAVTKIVTTALKKDDSLSVCLIYLTSSKEEKVRTEENIEKLSESIEMKVQKLTGNKVTGQDRNTLEAEAVKEENQRKKAQKKLDSIEADPAVKFCNRLIENSSKNRGAFPTMKVTEN